MKPFRVSLTGRFLVLLALAALLSACQGEAPGTSLNGTQYAESGVAGSSQNETATTTPSTGTSAQTGAMAMNTGGSGTLTMGQTGGIPSSVQATGGASSGGASSGGASSGGATQDVMDAGGTSNGGTSATPVTGACAADQTTCPNGNGTDRACPSGQELCGDTCQSIQDNNAHCGECFNACGEGLSCQGTSCECGADLSACGDSCIDVQSDPQNCGSCGTQCGSTQTCSGGNCAGGSCTSDNMTYNGRITYYDLATPLANCSFPTNLLPQYYAAMNEEDYANAAACGTCVQITNTQNNSQLVVQVVDQCPYQGNEEWCYAGSHHIDLNPPAYQALGASNNPPITWRYVSCNHGGNIQYLIEQNSSEYYLAVAIMNHENQIAKVEVQVNGAFRSMTRPAHNEWELTTGAGNGPFTFRITDIHGNVVSDSNVPFTKGQPIDGSGQFPTCQ